METTRKLMNLMIRSVVLLSLSDSLAGAQTSDSKIKFDPQSINAAADELYSAVLAAVTEEGGQPQTEQLSLALAFSTGHFASDPGMAQAARAISSALVDRHLVQGDTVRAYAWEMNVWPHPGRDLNPFIVSESQPGSSAKADVNRLWPRSTQPDSKGGHDTEQTALTIGEELANASDTALILLTNTAYSVASSAQKPIGEGSEAYKAFAETYKRQPAIDSSGASVKLNFRELTTDRERHIDAVIFVPTAYKAAAMTGADRDALLKAKTTESSPSPGMGWLWYLLALPIVGAVAYFIFRPKPPVGGGSPSQKTPVKGALAVDIEGTVVPLPAPNGSPLLARLVRSGSAPADRTVILPETRLPSVLATLELQKNSIEIKPERDVKLISINGKPVSKSVVALQAGTYRLEFKGQYREKESLPPKPFTHTVRLRISPATPATQSSPKK